MPDVADNNSAAAGRVAQSLPSAGRGLGGWPLLFALTLAAVSINAGARDAALPATGTVEAWFTPWDDAEGAILHALGEARQSIHVQAFLLTSRAIARALEQAHGRGVRVEVLADREMLQKGENSLLPRIAAAGIPVWLETRYASAHNKVILVDAESAQPAVITGSYNFTWSAQARNAENLLVLRGNPALARRYLDNWRRHRDEAETFDGAKHEKQ